MNKILTTVLALSLLGNSGLAQSRLESLLNEEFFSCINKAASLSIFTYSGDSIQFMSEVLAYNCMVEGGTLWYTITDREIKMLSYDAALAISQARSIDRFGNSSN